MSTTEDLSRYGYGHNAHVADPDEWVAIFRMPHEGPPGIWRLVMPAEPDVDESQLLSDDYLQDKIQNFIPKVGGHSIPWRGLYRVHQCVAEKFRIGRVVLAGDAAHINNPIGGLGLNSGLHDAANLAEKLPLVYRNPSKAYVLDLYAAQRRAVATELVQAMSIRSKKLIEERDPDVRSRNFKELADVASNPEHCLSYLREMSLISSLQRAALIN